MSIPDDIQSFELTTDKIMFIALGVVIVVFAYVVIFHAIPLGEARDAQLDEIRNNMSCGDLKEMILDKSGMSMQNRAEVKHQYEWRCEK